MTVVNVDTGEIVDTLSDDESRLLAACEAVLADPDVGRGMALRDIRDGRLYRATHGTFEAYCQDKWGLSRPRAYQLIDAASVIEAMSTMVDTPELNERQARAIAPVLKEHGPEAAADVLRQASEAGPLTAASIREAATADPVVTPASPEVVEALAEADAAYRATRQRSDFVRACGRYTAVLIFQPEHVASYADQECLRELDLAVEGLTGYRDRVRRAVGGLRIVNGDQR